MTAFPAGCPACKAYTVTNATAHCTAPHCPWLRCKCDYIFRPNGRGKKRKDLTFP